jgi:hypothetical protein
VEATAGDADPDEVAELTVVLIDLATTRINVSGVGLAVGPE